MEEREALMRNSFTLCKQAGGWLDVREVSGMTGNRRARAMLERTECLGHPAATLGAEPRAQGHLLAQVRVQGFPNTPRG